MKRKIGLIPGTGEQGRGIAARLVKAGFDVTIGSRAKEKAQRIAKELNELLPSNKIRGKANEEVAKECDLVFIILPYENLEEMMKKLIPFFNPGTIVVDVVVPLKFKNGLAYIPENLPNPSASELLQNLLPENITVVGAFKTISARTLARIDKPINMDVFLTSDNMEAKNELMTILRKIEGLRALDAGSLIFSRTIEQMTALIININKMNKVKHASFRVISYDE